MDAAEYTLPSFILHILFIAGVLIAFVGAMTRRK